MQETYQIWVRSLGREDPLEEEMAIHSSMPVWRILTIFLPGEWTVHMSNGHVREESDMTEAN